MNIEKFRHDFKWRMKQTGRSINSLVAEYGFEQAAHSRFVNDLSEKRGLSGRYVLALFPFVYHDGNPIPTPDESRP